LDTVFLTLPNSHSCEKFFEILTEKQSIRICANHKSNPISVSADAHLENLEKTINQFVPTGRIGNAVKAGNIEYSLEKIPEVKLHIQSSNQISGLIESFSMILPITLIILLFGIFLVLFFMWSKILRAQSNILQYFTNIVSGNSQNLTPPKSFGFSDLESTMTGIVDRIIAFEQNQKEVELLNLSKQISHDIRSPLTALNLLSGTLTELPEEKRILVRNSINRINDIANSLLERSKNPVQAHQTEEQMDSIMVSSLVDSIVSEKRIQFRETPNIQIESRLEMAYGLFLNVRSKQLKRVISNLINNSVEAFRNSEGVVVISAGATEYSVIISIRDNGLGIPKEVLNKIGEEGFSFGKSSLNQSGSGLGVFYARKTIESHSGTFRIESEQNIGTLVTIELPKIAPPSWFLQRLDLTPGQHLIICDDDTSIHQIWSGRLKSLQMNSRLEIVNFSSGSAFKNWIVDHSHFQFICLVDYELLNQSQNGLDIIEELGIQSNAILVTSRYEEIQIRRRCWQLGLKLIPKDVAGFVPIQFKESQKFNNNCIVPDVLLATRSIETNLQPVLVIKEKFRYDLCLIDDDQTLVGPMWAMVAASKGLKIKLFATPNEFAAEADKIEHQTPIYIDVTLGNGISGIDVAHDICKMGFTEINLATGYQADSINIPSFITRVVGKDFPDFINANTSEN